MLRKTPYLACGLALCGMLFSSTPASAQLRPIGGSFQVAAAAMRGNGSAYDSRNNVFLAVGAHGALMARLINPDGTFASDQFRIDQATGYPQYPGAAYSPDADGGRGAFLVTWHQNIGSRDNFVHARLVSATGALLGKEFTIGTEPTWWEVAPMIEYATKSQVFMVTWRTTPYQIRAARISNTGANLDAATDPFGLGRGIIVTTGGQERDASVAYNPENDTFLISWASFAVAGGAAHARLVSAATGALGAAQLLGTGTVVHMTDATFSTSARKFLVGWFQRPGGATGRFVNADGMPSGNPIPLTARFGSYDSFGIAYNQVTGTSLAVGQDSLSFENGGAEIPDSGVPGLSTVLTNAGGPTGNFYPQVSASTKEAKWLLTTAHNFTSLFAQFATATPVTQKPIITTEPQPRTARKGDQVTFTAAASGSPAPTVQWYVSRDGGVNWSAISGATGTTYSFTVKTVDNQKLYRAYFLNVVGQVYSKAVLLTVTSASFGDFDGDGVADPLVWRPSTGTFYWSKSSDAPINSVAGGIQWGNLALGDVVLSGANMDGDNLDDLVVWRATTGTWYWLTSSSGYNTDAAGVKQWGNASLGDVPLLADMDGDGISDLVVWRASTGTWYWLTSSSGYNYNAAGLKQWGNQGLGDKPLTGDFDGDGSADLAVWRASTGEWFWLKSSSGYAYAAMGYKQWGNAALGDRTLVGDMDGDRRSDLVIWRPGTGTWYWLTSSSGYSYASARGVQWGSQALGDKPLLADFDDDGLSDLIVFRPASAGAEWYWLTSSSGYTYGVRRLFGSAGDIPLLK